VHSFAMEAENLAIHITICTVLQKDRHLLNTVVFTVSVCMILTSYPNGGTAHHAELSLIIKTGRGRYA
jgi:hypothetical protein